MSQNDSALVKIITRSVALCDAFIETLEAELSAERDMLALLAVNALSHPEDKAKALIQQGKVEALDSLLCRVRHAKSK